MEGAIAAGLTAIQGRFPALDIGSYPYYREGGGGVSIVAKGTDAPAAEAAIREVTALMREIGGSPVQGEPPA
jgi:molybdopterin-biosynthesis enzyme MoeA-like protein